MVNIAKKFSLLFIFIAFLGLVTIVINSQMRQGIKSYASSYVGDYNGNLTLGGVSLSGSVRGDVRSNGNSISGSIYGDLIGSGNSIGGNVTGCLIGNSNSIGGKVFRSVSGTGNSIGGGSGSGPCLSGGQSPTSMPANAQVNISTPTSSHPLPTDVVAAYPTVIISPGAASINVAVSLHGIGSGGDSLNPEGGGNPNPIHFQRSTRVELYDDSDQIVVTKGGTVTYDSQSGKFKGVFPLDPSVSGGVYKMKVIIKGFIQEPVANAQMLVAGEDHESELSLVAGDIAGDNRLDILDYNILAGCYSDLSSAASCTPDDKILSDLTDDGQVNQYDYNLFLRELYGQN